MTDIYQYTVLDVQDDRVELELVLLYPDADEPEGRGFAKHLLWSLVQQLNCPEHPYLQAIEQYANEPPSYVIRSINLLTSTHDPEQADMLRAFASDFSDLSKDNTWTVAIRVRLPQWLDGLKAEMWGTTSAGSTAGVMYDDWVDGNDTYGVAEEWAYAMQRHVASYGTEALIPPMLLPIDRMACEGYSAPINRYDRLSYLNPHLPILLDQEDADQEPDEGIYTVGFFENYQAAFFLIRPTESLPWHQALVYAEFEHLWDWPTFPPKCLFGNLGHFLQTMMARTIEHETRPVFKEMFQLDNQRLNAWIEAEGFDTDWKHERASLAMLDYMMADDVKMPLLYSVLGDLLTDLSIVSTPRQIRLLRLIDRHHDKLYKEMFKPDGFELPMFLDETYHICCFMTVEPQHYDLYFNALKQHVSIYFNDALPMALVGLLNARGSLAIADIWVIIDSVFAEYTFWTPEEIISNLFEQACALVAFFETHQRALPEGFFVFYSQLEKQHKDRNKTTVSER